MGFSFTGVQLHEGSVKWSSVVGEFSFTRIVTGVQLLGAQLNGDPYTKTKNNPPSPTQRWSGILLQMTVKLSN